MKARDFWVAAFLVGLLAPIALRFITIERQSFGQELVTISGLIATSLLVSTVILPARLKSVTRAFGIEAVLANHRTMGAATAVVTLAHLALVVLNDPRYVALAFPFLRFVQPVNTIAPPPLLNPLITPPARAQAAMLSTVAMVVLVIWAARRRGRYERWRLWHIVLTILALVGAALHIILIGHLIPTNAIWHWILGDPIGLEMTRAALAWDAGAPVYLAVLALVLTIVGVNRWLIRPLRSRGRYRVAQVRRVNDNVSTLVLRREDGKPTEFAPGQFAWIRLRESALTEEHPFTISSAAQDGDIEFTIKRAGDWTSEIDTLSTGEIVWLDGPHGAFTPTEDTTGVVLIAAGVGITPALSMLRTAARDFDRRAWRLLIVGEPLLRQELYQLSAFLTLETHELGQGRVTAERLDPLLPPGLLRDQQDYYICGPPLLVDDVTAALAELGVPEERVHTERF